jgi:2-aminoethylphosphonate transport system substrate-binding protein
MRMLPTLAAALLAVTALSWTAARAEDVVTIYSADGLKDGDVSWYGTQFDAFTKATGIKVQYIEAGSGGVVQRVAKEVSNPQADVLVTLPPFIQKAVADGLTQPYTPAGAEKVPAGSKDAAGNYTAICNNYLSFIYNGAMMPDAPASFATLLEQRFKNKIQYSTPGQAGDGTAVMLQVIHAYGSKDAAFDYFKQLQTNNRGPSSSTGKLTALVNKGELWVANGDLQMNLDQSKSNPNIRIFFLAGPDGKRSTFALPYFAALVKGAPHADNGKKLIDWLLTTTAQQSLPELALGLPARLDVTASGAAADKIEGALKGVEIWTPDWKQVSEDLSKDAARWHEATGS